MSLKLKGGEVPEELNFVQQMAKQSYNIGRFKCT
jgi:hypothetical protein